MSDTVIKAENISKAYQLGEFSTGTLTRDIERRWALLRGKEDPFLKVGETNNRTSKGDSDVVWSLKDINFEIRRGDAVGIIGRNGAGKSTLLKVLSRVTAPTTGNIKVKGRIASLLEVGTGFHPELTGRENIYLNGAILGMRKKEIRRKFDEIVDFAGVERYIDTPVKRYSSGMYVRLAFAVAAHLESEILIVDEVLAVGDAEFQKKCLGKMGDVSKGEGRTVLFVSHNMSAVRKLCSTGIFLNTGQLVRTGRTDDIIQLYHNSIQGGHTGDLLTVLKYHDDSVWIKAFRINEEELTSITLLPYGRINVLIELESRISSVLDFEFHIEAGEQLVCSYSPVVTNKVVQVHEGTYQVKAELQLPELANGIYQLKFGLSIPRVKHLVTTRGNISFEYVNAAADPGYTNTIDNWGKILMNGSFQIL